MAPLQRTTGQGLAALLLTWCCLVHGQIPPGSSPGGVEDARARQFGAYFSPRGVQHSGQLARLSAAASTDDKEASAGAATTQQEPGPGPGPGLFQQGFGFGQGFNVPFNSQPFPFSFGQGGGFGTQQGLVQNSHAGSALGQTGTAADSSGGLQSSGGALGQGGGGLVQGGGGLVQGGGELGQGGGGLVQGGGGLVQGGTPFGQQHQFGNLGHFNGFGQGFGPVAAKYTELNGAGSGQDGSTAQVSSGSVVGFYGNAPGIGFHNQGFGVLPGQLTGGPRFPGFGFSGGFSNGALNSVGGSGEKGGAISGSSNKEEQA